MYKFQQNIQPTFRLSVRESSCQYRNRLLLVLAAVDRASNETVAENKNLLITTSQYNIYSVLKYSGKLCFPL